MKKIILSAEVMVLFLIALFCSTWNVRATGSVGINQPQSGVMNFTAASGLFSSNMFPIPYSIPPAMVFTPATTNGTPVIVTAITTTNFILTITNGTTWNTNATIGWTAYLPYPRIQSGTNNIATVGALVTNTFSAPYISPPAITLVGANTNSQLAIIGVVSVTATGFVYTSPTNQAVIWTAFGQAYAPGNQNVTY